MQGKVIPGVSVIICCYNSAQRLPKTIEHLAKQQVPSDVPWEVIVVDNASTDDTSAVAQKLWEDYEQPATFQIVEEKQAGLSFARHAGFISARYKYCLFCDDDNWLHFQYVSNVYQILEEHQNVAVLGGKGEAVFEDAEPTWFEEYKGFYAVGSQGRGFSASVLKSKGHVYGAGMVIRKSMYQELVKEGFKSILSDRKGNSLASGGDTELCLALALKGFDIFYDERLTFKHYIPSGRTSKVYLKNLVSSISASWVLLHPYLYALDDRRYRSDILVKDIAYVLSDMVRAYFRYIVRLFTKEDPYRAYINFDSRAKALYNLVVSANIYNRKMRSLLKAT